MSLPVNITLMPPYVAILGSTSIDDIQVVDENLQWGTVQETYNGCGSVAVNDSVLFDIRGMVQFRINNVAYFKVDEKNIFFIEPISV